MTSDENNIREDIYDDLYANKRSPLAKEIIREAARQYEGVYRAWTRRVLDTTNYDHVMVSFEEVLDEVVETYVCVELEKLREKRSSRPTKLTLAAVAKTTSVTPPVTQPQSPSTKLNKAMNNLTLSMSFKDAVTSGQQSKKDETSLASVWTTVGRKNKPLTTKIARRNSDELQDEEYFEEYDKSTNESTFLSGATVQEDNNQDETSAEVPQPAPAVVAKQPPTKIEWVEPKRTLPTKNNIGRDETSDRMQKQAVTLSCLQLCILFSFI